MRTPIPVDEQLREALGGLVGAFQSVTPVPANFVVNPTASSTVSDNAVIDILRAQRRHTCIPYGRCGRGDSIPRAARHLLNAVHVHAIFHALVLDEDRGIRSGAHSKRALCLL